MSPDWQVSPFIDYPELLTLPPCPPCCPPHLLSSTLLSALSVLPIKHHLLYLTLPQLVQQLYQGLSNQSLSCILRLVIGFVKWTSDTSSAEERELCSGDTILKFSKIIFSLMFSNDVVNDWGKSIILLAVRLSILYPATLDYVYTQLGTQSTVMQSWYFGIVLSLCKRKGDVMRGYELVKEGLSPAERGDAEYQIKLMS